MVNESRLLLSDTALVVDKSYGFDVFFVHTLSLTQYNGER